MNHTRDVSEYVSYFYINGFGSTKKRQKLSNYVDSLARSVFLGRRSAPIYSFNERGFILLSSFIGINDLDLTSEHMKQLC